MFCDCVCIFLKKHENQCNIVAAFTILTSIALITLSILYLLPNHHELRVLLTRLNMADNSAVFLSTISLLLCSIWMVSGILLIAGVKKNASGLVLFYFVYGIFFTITLHVAALLLLLHKDWAFSFGIILTSVIHIRGLVSGYQTYDLMQRGKVLGDGANELLVEDLPDENV
ncbi:uncharacterized protein LOC128674289 isoform X2 [Plodia interpunctella]|uniref:uncharacterized protein LOC128674289 isoform X2 n=1 Tax=Plodia interpunctella TaxID=58824 RepID=UPI002368E339|nr:uncharacterized protein LOC128674289 isoform X2 [Plodia interpunctella]